MDIPQPNPSQKKIRRGRNALIAFVVVVVVLAFAVAALGIYDIPIVSAILGTNRPKDLGVKASPEALASLQQKMPVTVEGAPGNQNLCLTCRQTYEGQIAIEARRTSEEVTSFLQLFPREKGDILKDTQVKFIEGGMEISTKVKKYVHAPVYVKVKVQRTGSQSVSLNVEQAKIGNLMVPENYLRKGETFFQDLVNEHLAEISGYSMEKLEYHDGYSDFKGTYPAVVKPASGKWTDAL